MILALTLLALAQVAPVTTRVGVDRAWVGQRVDVNVEIRAPGTFSGASSLDLPEIPGVILVPMGRPVVSSETVDGESIFVQSHPLALFSQRDGEIEVPPFTVRFAHLKGFTGDPIERVEEAPAVSVTIVRPAAASGDGFLVSTSSLQIEQSWDPTPSSEMPAGTVLTRRIVQRADDVSAIALAAPPTSAPESVRVYDGSGAETDDAVDRGSLVGTRTDVLRYLLGEAGSVELPAIQYRWWDVEAEELRSSTLEGLTVDVVANGPDEATEGGGPSPSRSPWPWAALLVAALAVVFRGSIARAAQAVWNAIDPPEKRARRALLRACDRSDAHAAERALQAWPDARGGELAHATLDLERSLYGAAPSTPWNGAGLARAIRAMPRQRRHAARHRRLDLPPLNGTAERSDAREAGV
ncbi:MAG: hypothetical protein AAGA20_09700 [Planctomycetota bacterium]